MSNESIKTLNFCLDSVFKEKTEYLDYTFDIYRKIYDLKNIKYRGEVSEELFQYVKKRKYFVLLAIYDEDGKIYLERNIQDKLYWSLPGGSILKNEDMHSAIKRITRRVREDLLDVVVGEVEPIAFVENEFVFNGEKYVHYGIAFSARIRNKLTLAEEDSLGSFIHLNDEETAKINRFANREVAKLCVVKIKNTKTQSIEREVATNEKYKFRYFIHNNFVKRFILSPLLKRRSEFIKLLNEKISGARSFIDVSCGDSGLIFELAAKNNFDYAVANDVSWSQIKTMHKQVGKVLFANHDSTHLPFRENSFDVAYCGNTLHHMPTKEALALLLGSVFKVANKVLIVEIERPGATGLFSYLLHRIWYRGFLKDVGGAYLSKDEFRVIIDRAFAISAEIKYSEFRNIQGRYLIAEVTRKNLVEIDIPSPRFLEIEEKFFSNDSNGIVNRAKEKGYTEESAVSETDIYFSDLDGTFIKNRTCLRLRDKGKDVELTFKGKSFSLSHDYAKVEHNVRLSKESLPEIKNLLRVLGFHIYISVNKRRRIFTKEMDGVKFSIALDNVKNAGNFVEFEALVNSLAGNRDGVLKTFKDEISKFSNLGLTKAEMPYRDYVASNLAKELKSNGQPECLLLDFDGTIVPSELVFQKSFNDASERFFGRKISMDEYKKYELGKDGQLIDYLISTTGKSIDRKNFMNFVYENYSDRFESIISHERTILNLVILSEIKNKLGIKLALNTTSKKIFVERVLSATKNDKLFNIIVAREDVSKRKPAPEGYLRILENLHIGKEKCLAIEDSMKGVESAVSAGVKCVTVINDSIVSRNDLEKKSVPVFEDLAQVYLLLAYG